MKNFTCCFTGHRTLPTNKTGEILLNLEREVKELLSKGITNFISGGAIGFDQIAASLVIAQRKTGNANIRLIFALPCKNQDKFWNVKQKSLYRELLLEADEIIYVSEVYDDSCMRKRNHFMVEHSSYCICALLQEKSGTGQTVRYAKKNGLQIINVAK